MFEQYTDKARRAIFFARYEASEFGSPYIEAGFLLLGILREEKHLINRWLGNGDWQSILREDVERGICKAAKISTSVDLPLSNEAKDALRYAAEESERLGHKHIGTEHLFLGLLCDRNSSVGRLLLERGVNAEAVREAIAKGSAHPGDSNILKRDVAIQHHLVAVEVIPEKGDPLVPFGWQSRIPVVGEFLTFDDDLGRSTYYQVVRVEWKVTTHPIETPFLSRVLIHVKEFTLGYTQSAI